MVQKHKLTHTISNLNKYHTISRLHIWILTLEESRTELRAGFISVETAVCISQCFAQYHWKERSGYYPFNIPV